MEQKYDFVGYIDSVETNQQTALGPIYTGGGIVHLCKGCGAAVLDQDQHNLFHNKTRSTV